jgi:carbonic anhydrase
MNARGLKHEYDQVILAGASLGALTSAYPEWNTTFWQHLDLAIQLHSIQRVIVVDHRDCGAYKLVLGQDLAADLPLETQVHAEWLRALRDAINAKYPDLGVELFLMALDGTVEQID